MSLRVAVALLLACRAAAFAPSVLKGSTARRSDSTVAHAMQNEWKKKGPLESAGGPGNVLAAATVPVQFKVRRSAVSCRPASF